jgi:hypothetical protein
MDARGVARRLDAIQPAALAGSERRGDCDLGPAGTVIAPIMHAVLLECEIVAARRKADDAPRLEIADA